MSFVAWVLDQLCEVDGVVTSRAMFGGHGLYLDGAFFAIAYDDRLWFKTDESTRAAYVDAGMPVFHPPKGPVVRSYYEVPPHVVDDRALLAAWAREAAEVATRS